MDAVIVRFLARKAKRLARKWGGQCIVFIDEIDAVGMRRQSLGTGQPGHSGIGGSEARERGSCFFEASLPRPDGSIPRAATWSLETRGLARPAVRRARAAPSPVRRRRHRRRSFNRACSRAGRMGGGLALNQLLVVMDGIGNPPFVSARCWARARSTCSSTRCTSSRAGSASCSLRMPPAEAPQGADLLHRRAQRPDRRARSRAHRPGRMGRHVWFRTPTKDDRKDIFDLYMRKVAHEPDLDSRSAATSSRASRAATRRR